MAISVPCGLIPYGLRHDFTLHSEKLYSSHSAANLKVQFLPRCIKCRRGLAMRILSVRLSVCLSVRRVIPDKMEERSVQIYVPYERTFSLA